MPIEDEHVNPHVLRRLCDLADARMIDGDRDSLRLARLCCRIAAKLNSDAGMAASFGCLASALRLYSRFDHAEQALAISLSRAPVRMKGDLLRRRCYLNLYQKRFDEALVDAETSAATSIGADRVRALGAVGIVCYYRKEYRRAIQELERCLASTNPDSESEYCNAIQNYSTALSKGTDDEARKGLKLCKKARSFLKRRHRMQRAKLWWTTGLLHRRLGNPQRAWSAFDIARRSLIALEAAPEVAAIVADMALIAPKLVAIRQICGEARAVIKGRHPLTQPLRALARAARDLVPQAAADLRREATTLAPCPAL